VGADRLPGIDAHPHARAVLLPALPPQGHPSHAYLLHGPAGTGKRDVARAFAAALLADGAPDPQAALGRVARGAHPDLTWVTASGASEMLVADIEEPVVAAAARTPFEAARRVFVIEGVDAMTEQAANRMLKTLEEPAPFAHLVLLTDRREDVLPTIASRCQHVRFDPPPPERIAAALEGVEGDVALACARLALGDAGTAATLASEQGSALRAGATHAIRSVLSGATADRPWRPLLEMARQAGAAAGAAAQEHTALELEFVPSRERARHRREGDEAARRVERRARIRTLDLALRLQELWLRDMLCVREGAPELIHAVDMREQITQDAGDREPGDLREGVALIGDTRLSLAVNVSEELALESLAYRLQALLAG
jgi:DNA polymerase-3 subunit delta'